MVLRTGAEQLSADLGRVHLKLKKLKESFKKNMDGQTTRNQTRVWYVVLSQRLLAIALLPDEIKELLRCRGRKRR